jgi:uncharacterized membrane protein YeaQ/YmgE (transglycosylase-associated protein family)
MPETNTILVWLIIGAVAGAAAGGLVRRNLYFFEMVLAGLLGALVGGFIIEAVGLDLPDASLTFTLGDLITSFIGAAILIVLAELIMGVRRR